MREAAVSASEILTQLSLMNNKRASIPPSLVVENTNSLGSGVATPIVIEPCNAVRKRSGHDYILLPFQAFDSALGQLEESHAIVWQNCQG